MTVDVKNLSAETLTAIQDDVHLRLLSQLHIVKTIVNGVFWLFLAGYFAFIFFLFGIGAQAISDSGESAEGAQFFVIAMAIVCALTLGCLLLLLSLSLFTGIYLKQRKGYWLCFITSCLECLLFPYGTLLGVYALIILTRPSVKAAFGKA